MIIIVCCRYWNFLRCDEIASMSTQKQFCDDDSVRLEVGRKPRSNFVPETSENKEH